MATHVYPSGPDPVANPLITSFVDPPFLAVYAYLGAVVAATLSWTFRRRFGCAPSRCCRTAPGSCARGGAYVRGGSAGPSRPSPLS